MCDLELHNVRFYSFNPLVIHCLAYHEQSKLLALSRSNNCIEIWNCSGKVFKQHELADTRVSSIEALVWCGDRLLSAGLTGFILEYDIKKCEVINKTSATGGSIWCMALSPNGDLLATGTEEGFVNLFEVTSEGLVYNKILARQQGRILSISWHPSGEKLVTGSVDVVHLFHINKGLVLQIPVGRKPAKKETIVFCVAMLGDDTIVTGDSRGKTSFWSGADGTLCDAVDSHQADVLCMQVTPDQRSVYVAGVDPVVVQINKVQTGKSKSKEIWVKGVHRRIHTHDIRAMVLTLQDRLFTGGGDTYLIQSYFPPKTAIKYPAIPNSGYLSVSETNSVLLGYEDKLELWRLGVVGKGNNGQYFPVKEDRVKLLDLNLKRGEKLVCCSLSPNGALIAYVVKGNLKIFRFNLPKGNDAACLTKGLVDGETLNPCKEVMWLTDDMLLSHNRTEVIQVLTCNNGEWSVCHEINIPEEQSPLRIALPKGSSMPKFTIACTDMTNKTHIIKLRVINNSIKGNKTITSTLITLPSVKWKTSAMAIDTLNHKLFTAHSNLQLLEYDYKSNRYTKLTDRLKQIGSEWFKRNLAIDNISYGAKECIYLQDANNIHVINTKWVDKSDDAVRPFKQRKDEGNRSFHRTNCDETRNNGEIYGQSKKEESEQDVDTPLTSKGIISTFERANNVLFTTSMTVNSLVSFELDPIALLDKLPPPLKQKKFGKA